MAKTIETQVFEFDELSDPAKEKAREWFRTSNEGDNFFSECIIEGAAEDLKNTFGVTLDTYPVQLMGGGVRHDPRIAWSGFASQGDGASFAGRVDLPLWLRSQKLAGKYRALYNSATFHDVDTRITIDPYAHYCHEYTMAATVEIGGYPDDPGACNRLDEQAETVQELLLEWARDYARKIYKNLNAEWDYVNDDEQVDDSIRANEYTFTAKGKRFG